MDYLVASHPWTPNAEATALLLSGKPAGPVGRRVTRDVHTSVGSFVVHCRVVADFRVPGAPRAALVGNVDHLPAVIVPRDLPMGDKGGVKVASDVWFIGDKPAAVGSAS